MYAEHVNAMEKCMLNIIAYLYVASNGFFVVTTAKNSMTANKMMKLTEICIPS